MNRRSFMAGLGAALLLPEPPRVRTYSFMPGVGRIEEWREVASLDIHRTIRGPTSWERARYVRITAATVDIVGFRDRTVPPQLRLR